MDPFEPSPSPTPLDPLDGLSTPSLDEPPRLDARFAFAPGRAIGNGISALKRAPAPMFVAGLITVIIDGNFPGGGGGGGGGGDYDDDYDRYSDVAQSIGHPLHVSVSDSLQDAITPAAAYLQVDPELMARLGAALGAMLCLLVLFVAFWVARCFMKPGVIRLHSHILQTGDQNEFKVMFSGGDRFVAMMGWGLLSGTIVFASVLLVLALPALCVGFAAGTLHSRPLIYVGLVLMLVIGLPLLCYVNLGLALGDHAVTLEGRSPIEALKRSWTLARGNRWQLFVFYLVVGLFQLAAIIVGILLCCVGLIATMPAARAATDFATTEAFLLLTRGEEVSAYWRLWELKAEGVC